MVNSTLKNTQGISVECMEYVNEDAQKRKEEKYDTFCKCEGRDDQIATNAKLLDIMLESYGFSVDLIEAIN